MPAPNESARRVSRMRLAWAGLVASIIPYAVCVLLWTRTAPTAVVPQRVRIVLWGLALYMAFASIRWRWSIARSSEVPIPTARLQSRCLGTWAMSASVAIFGLFLAFFSHSAIDFAPLAVLALALLFVHRPWSPPFAGALAAIGRATSDDDARLAALSEEASDARVRALLQSGRTHPRWRDVGPWQRVALILSTALGLSPFALVGWGVAGWIGAGVAVLIFGCVIGFIAARSIRGYRDRVMRVREAARAEQPGPPLPD